MKKAKPNKGEGGRIYADVDGGWYYIVNLLDDGKEKRVLSTNALFHIQDAANRFSTEIPGFTSDLFIIDGRTHKAIAFYKKDEGLQEDWPGEVDEEKALRRKEAYENKIKIIEHLNE